MLCRGNIKGERIVLRAVEPQDIDVMYGIENDIHNWGVSGTTAPFSRYLLERFVESQSVDIHTSRQLRLMITKADNNTVVGIIDIFDFDPYNHRAGVGIIIIEGYRAQGYAKDALALLHGYCLDILQMHQLWCDVEASNEASLKLFRGLGYCEVGRKREWQYVNGSYQDEILMQKIL